MRSSQIILLPASPRLSAPEKKKKKKKRLAVKKKKKKKQGRDVSKEETCLETNEDDSDLQGRDSP